MPEKIPYYKQKRLSKENNYSEVFILIYHISITIGIAISVLYFAFIAKTLPTFGTLSDIIGYLVVIFGISTILAIIFFGFILLPSVLFNIAQHTKKQRDKLPSIYILAFFITQSLFILWVCLTYEVHNTAWLIMLAISAILFLIPTFLLYLNLKSEKPEFILPLLLVIPSLLTHFYLIFLIVSGSLDTNFETSVIQYFVVTFVLGGIIWVANKIFIDRVSLDNIKNFKQSLLYLLAIFFLTIVTLSTLFTLFKKPNIFIINPFSISKLGYYRAELNFKKDFIEKSNPFISNETNETKNVFFIWSSIGNEYIIQEIAPGYPVYENNKTFIVIDINKTTKYKYNKQNTSELYELSINKNTLIDKDLLTKYIQVQLDKQDKIYRIKKENVAAEITGNEIAKTTVWFKN